MFDYSDHPFSPTIVARESGDDASTARWLAWCCIVERLLGHSLDGNQAADGYSIDYAYDSYRRGSSPLAYVQSVERLRGE